MRLHNEKQLLKDYGGGAEAAMKFSMFRVYTLSLHSKSLRLARNPHGWGAKQSCCHSLDLYKCILSAPACFCSYVCIMRKVPLIRVMTEKDRDIQNQYQNQNRITSFQPLRADQMCR